MAFPSSFNAQGVLAPGTYQLTLTALRESWLVTGKGLRIREWDSAWRAQLVDNLGVLVNELRSVGLERVFVGGSFVEQRPHPGDVDGYFECPLFYYT
ncbi:MAG: DUF6932 family protein, partial [Chloroflexota bacterium]